MTAKLVVWAVAALAAAIIAVVVIQGIHESGRDAERQTVIHQNTEDGDAGENARLGRRDCIGRGMLYDFETRKCSHP